MYHGMHTRLTPESFSVHLKPPKPPSAPTKEVAPQLVLDSDKVEAAGERPNLMGDAKSISESIEYHEHKLEDDEVGEGWAEVADVEEELADEEPNDVRAKEEEEEELLLEAGMEEDTKEGPVGLSCSK